MPDNFTYILSINSHNHEIDIPIPILQMRKLRLTEANYHSQAYIDLPDLPHPIPIQTSQFSDRPMEKWARVSTAGFTFQLLTYLSDTWVLC